MDKVFKFPIVVGDTFVLDLPSTAEVLHVGEQDGALFMWARVNPRAPTVQRMFRMAGTGHELGASVGPHIGTVQSRNGLVWHFFEVF